jgi:hypothetical protein
MDALGNEESMWNRPPQWQNPEKPS